MKAWMFFLKQHLNDEIEFALHSVLWFRIMPTGVQNIF